MTDGQASLALLAAAWMAWFVVHSATASLAVKRLVDRAPALARRYRLLYNLVALVSLALPGVALLAASGPLLFERSLPVAIVLDGLGIAALAGFAFSTGSYPLARFAGLHNPSATSDGAPLRLRGLGRRVRHPWYSLGLVIIWTRPMDAAWLLSAVLLTGYLVVGARLEERKLVTEFGEAYRRYQARVPMFLPVPGRRLSPDEANELESLAGR